MSLMINDEEGINTVSQFFGWQI